MRQRIHRQAEVFGSPFNNEEDGEDAHERWRWGEEIGHHMEPPAQHLIHDPGFSEPGPSFHYHDYDKSLNDWEHQIGHGHA